MLRRLPLSIKLPAGAITDEYIDDFKRAFMTFRHQVVFDPLTRQRRPLIEVSDTCCRVEHPRDMMWAGRSVAEKMRLFSL